MTLFLDGIMNNNKNEVNYPGKVRITVPVIQGNSSVTVCGLLTSEPSISGQNKWGPILAELQNIADVGSLMSEEQLFSWIGSSVNCWKGTEALKLNLDFSLINYKKGLDLEKALSALMKLASLTKGSDVTVKVHGGYRAKPLRENTEWFNGGDTSSDGNNDENLTWGDKLRGAMGNIFGSKNYTSEGQQMFGAGHEEGTITVYLGNTIMLDNLLVSTINYTPSSVEVFDGVSNGRPYGRPLYYNVSLGLIGCRPLLSNDIDSMFNVRK